MSANKLTFKIVTPERLVVTEQVDQVTLPTQEGQITVLKNHIPLVAPLNAGEILLKRDGEEIPLAVSGGFIEVTKDQVIVLADTAERVEEIDIQRAEEARKKAEALLKEKSVDTTDYSLLRARLEKELARLKVARRQRHNRLGGQKIQENQ